MPSRSVPLLHVSAASFEPGVIRSLVTRNLLNDGSRRRAIAYQPFAVFLQFPTVSIPTGCSWWSARCFLYFHRGGGGDSAWARPSCHRHRSRLPACCLLIGVGSASLFPPPPLSPSQGRRAGCVQPYLSLPPSYRSPASSAPDDARP